MHDGGLRPGAPLYQAQQAQFDQRIAAWPSSWYSRPRGSQLAIKTIVGQHLRDSRRLQARQGLQPQRPQIPGRVGVLKELVAPTLTAARPVSDS